MPTKIQVGSWYGRPFLVKVILWSLSQTLGIVCFGFDLLKWLLSSSPTIATDVGWKGAWLDVVFLWWDSVDRSNRWVGKTITILKHVPGEY